MNRPVNYERALWEWNTDMYVPQYPSAEWLEEIGRKGSDRPVAPSEYSHAMGTYGINGKRSINTRTCKADLSGTGWTKVSWKKIRMDVNIIPMVVTME